MINLSRHINPIQKFTIISIVFISIVVVAFSIYALAQPSSNSTDYIETQISTLSANYYEKYFFPKLESSVQTHSNSDLADVLSKYTATGFAEVPLRQILLHTEHDASISSIITEHCDINSTFVHFFPDSPFTSTSYHATYDYSCNF